MGGLPRRHRLSRGPGVPGPAPADSEQLARRYHGWQCDRVPSFSRIVEEHMLDAAYVVADLRACRAAKAVDRALDRICREHAERSR